MFKFFRKSKITPQQKASINAQWANTPNAQPPSFEDSGMLNAAIASDRYDRARAMAEEEIRYEMIRQGRTPSDEDMQFMVDYRTKEIEQMLTDSETQAVDNAALEMCFGPRTSRSHRQHRELVDSLHRIEQSMEANNVASEAVAFAKRHPFLTGFFGTHLYHKLTGK